MNHVVTLPALDGRDPLSFLAALGMTSVINGSRLSFDRDTAAATLHSPLPDCDAIAAALHDVIKSIPDDATLPDTPRAFPTFRRGNAGGDPMRMTRAQYRRYATDHPETHSWLAATLTDLTVDKQHRAGLTHYMAPVGKQSIGTFFSRPLSTVRKKPAYLHQALTNWERVEDFTGEYLDHRVLSTAADHPTGISTDSGVPGATWLATQALSLFRVTGTGTHIHSSGWHYHHRTRATYLIWPLWSIPLGVASIPALAEHPLLQPDPDHSQLTITATPQQLEELHIFYVAAARRYGIENRKFAGVLTPHPVTITPPHTKPTQATIL